jgi:mRNA-degrading endonuclease RelE of RelBE toxin-antitoxin system
VTSRTSATFRRDLAQLPARIRRLARERYHQFAQDPQHPSLKFKKLPPFDDIWSVRINNTYRAIGRVKDDVIVWFFIGSHADYDNLLERL